MKRSHRELGFALRSLFYFLFWYALAVILVFYLMPAAGLFVETRYESLSAVEKAAVFAVLLGGVAAGQWIARRRRKSKGDAPVIAIRGSINPSKK